MSLTTTSLQRTERGMNYSETIQYLYSSQPVFHMIGSAAYKPGLQNMQRLMLAMGNPHTQFRSIHIAGTNGKGSTAHLLAAILQSAGYRVGLYTSPHLVDYRERIRTDGKMIPKCEVTCFVRRHKTLLEDVRPSFFETTTAMAFSWFARQKVNIAVVEAGLGGRLDSTNIIKPCLSIITNIGLDHTEFLGSTLSQIAAEKAGIIKNGVPVVIGERNSDTASVFVSKAEATGSPLVFADERETEADCECQLKGVYQQKNIRTVLAAIDVLRQQGWSVSDEAVRQGLLHVCDLTGLQGRWQQLTYNGKRVILDTGHNSHGVRAYIDDLKKLHGLHVVFGMVSDKDVNVVLGLLPPKAKYYFTQAQIHRAIAAAEMQRMGAEVGLRGRAYPTVQKAIEAAISEAAADDTVFIGGSNYVVGEAIRCLTERLRG